MKSRLFKITILSLFLSTPLLAKDVYDIPAVKPILNPLYPAVPELSFSFSYFPVGAFNKHLGLGGSYISYVNSNHVWEVISAYYFFELPSGLKKTLIESYGAPEENFAVMQFMAKTGYQWMPFYSKSILFNSTLIHSRTFIGMSAGIASFKIESPPLASIGFGQNFYFGDNKAMKFMVDYLHYFKNNKYIQDQITVSLGIAFAWGKE